MPPSKKLFRLSAAYIEAIHDLGIELAWPGKEPVDTFTCRDLNLLASAAIQPFEGGFGIEEYYPTLASKAAYLFFHIATAHIFQNGNKRTAVMALDQFLMANSVYLLIPNEQMETLAEQTAEYRVNNESQDEAITRITQAIEGHSLSFASILKMSKGLHRRMVRFRKRIRDDERNAAGVAPKQAEFLGIKMPHTP